MFGKFFKDEGGYALTLMLLFLPVFVGIGLLVVDIGRGNNAQSDLQAAADALALAGARELDGREGAVEDAKAAMERISNRVGFLSVAEKAPVVLTYDAEATGTRPFFVAFLRAIPGDIDPATGDLVPGNDDTPIDSEFVSTYDATGDAATQDLFARYVLVQARSDDLDPLFFLPLTRTAANVPIAATAVATLKESTCELAPIFICNPIEGSGNGEEFAQKVKDGEFHGRLIKLDAKPNSSGLKPGNVGFLRTLGKGAPPLAQALAGTPLNECVDTASLLETQPGAVNSVWDAFNTRFDIYKDNTGDWSRTGISPPALNVRKAYEFKNNKGEATACGKPYSPTGQTSERLAKLSAWYAQNPIYSDNLEPDTEFDFDGTNSGDSVRKGIWNLLEPVTVKGVTYPAYWPTLYPGEPFDEEEVTSREDFFPSRYDVYRHELSLGLQSTLSPGGENGSNQCYDPERGEPAFVDEDRRTMFVAVIDCTGLNGNSDRIRAQFWAEVFLVHPGEGDTLNIELIDISGPVSNGAVDKYLRSEAMLVR